MKIKVLLFMLTCSTVSVFAQGLPCRATEENAKIYRDNPNALQEKINFDAFSKKFATQRANGTLKEQATTYTIPVVFHIYGEVQSGKTVTYEKIVNHLKQLNDDFNGRNADYATVEPFFQARRGTLDIEFKLAKLDPKGGCTTGVVFHPAKNGYGNGGGYDTQIAADAWDNKKYMNIYIQNDLYNDGALNSSGVAWYPDISMTNSNTARVVFNGAYLYDNSSNKEFSATLTHEFGHFLNLIHTFDGGCSGTDQVDDTPKEDGKHTLNCTPGTNCDGDKVNIENYMGYNGASGCYKMYTQGQISRMLAALQHPARKTLWQTQNLIDTGVALSGSSVVATASIFKESAANDGAFNTTSILNLTGTKKFALATGVMVAGTHFTHTFPAGITPVLTVNSNNQITLTLTGKASAHAASNSASGTIVFLPAAFEGGTTGVQCTSLFFKLTFINPYGIFYVDINDIVVSSSFTWQYFDINAGDDPSFGAWRFGPNALKIETYGKKLVCNSGTRNISLLAANVYVGASSSMTAPGAYPDQLDLRKAGYTVWDGKTGYVGFEYKIDGAICYGWFRIAVTANGDGYTILDYAYNTQPNEPIVTGQKVANTLLAPSNLVASINQTASSVQLTWVNNAPTATNVVVERAGTDGVFVVLATLANTATTYTQTGLTAGINYQYRIIAKTATGVSNPSTVVTVLIPEVAVPITLATPTNLYQAGVYPTGFYPAWGLVAGATLYEVQLKTGTTWTTFGTSETYYLWIPKQGSQMVYEFRVRALKGKEISDWSTSRTYNLDGSLGVFDLKNDTTFAMYPNPATDKLYFTVGAMDVAKLQIKVYSISGTVVAQTANATTLAVGTLQKGTYIVVATDGTYTTNYKLVIQ